MSEQPSYYAVIPASVRYADLNPNAKLLYGELTALTSKEGFCWASNSYFAELYGVDGRTISTWINQLKDAGFITSFVDKEGGNKRKIWITYRQKDGEGIDENIHSYRQKHPHITTSSTTVKKSANKFADSPILVVEEEPKKERKPKDSVALILREKLYTMFENSTGVRPTTTVADYVRVTEALKHLEEKHIEDMVENALAYGNEKTVREVLTARKIDIYRQENL